MINFTQAGCLAFQGAQVEQFGAPTWFERTTSTLSSTLELKGKIRSTPWPKLTLRTVKLPAGRCAWRSLCLQRPEYALCRLL